MRRHWSDAWLAVAVIIGERSRCDMRQVGAVIVSADNSYTCVGYNGPPRGFDAPNGSTCQDWCPRAIAGRQTRDYDNCVSAHAEMNALVRADRSRILGGTMYSSSSMCWDCGKVVANSGVSNVVMLLDPERDKHRDPERTIEFLRDCGLSVEVLST